ncbi:hypothetical protein B6N60_04888 [Richelia sinica FACHB-800]|uniref:Uncharacterized protein n=2 Tax=Richelia TaxID=98443 RepID=A0A975Y7C3_9NOST|nr:hypothetical protein [Richelia sinica FACHB-800]QXE26157.1 hypothetical protein B6N60_04888 [Richelia sinica FACHB-800]
MQVKRPQTPLLPEAKNLLAVCFLCLTGFNSLIFLLTLFTAFKVNKIAERKTTFAQLVNGETVYIAEQDRNWRYPAVIQKVVSDWTTLTFNWDDKLVGSNQNQTDSGIKVGNRRIPTATWFASLLLEPKFAQASLPKIAELVPTGVFTGQLRSTTIISYLSEPRAVRLGEWEIDMIATRILVDRTTGRDERISFNRTFTVQAVEIPRSPLGKDAPLIEQKIYEMRSSGLQITRMVEFNPQQRR